MNFQDLATELLGILRRGVDVPISDQAFNELAVRIFRFQCESNSAYAGFVSRRGVTPESVNTWEGIPWLPARAFKSVALVSGSPEEVERVFRTSGTTRGQGARGEHHVLDLAIYRESLLPNFKAHLLPDFEAHPPPEFKTPGGEGLQPPLLPREGEDSRILILCLLPSPEFVPESSLSFMMGEVVRDLGKEGSGFFLDAGGVTDVEGFGRALRSAEGAGEPVLVAGTAFGFVNWMESAKTGGWVTNLPEGSRIMETGGYKGRSRELPREDFYRSLEGAFGIPENRIVNEYGMTELLSQFYEPVLARPGDTSISSGQSRFSRLSKRFHCGPPWVRTRVLDPLTLRPLPPGEVGVLAHLDLANLGSVSGILTEDLGKEHPGGFRLVGRNPGSEPRGCSLAMEEFLASRGMDASREAAE